MAQEQDLVQQDLVREESQRHDRPTAMHPFVYLGVVGFTAWFVVAAWLSFAGSSGYIGVALVVMTGFFLMAAGIPFVLWRAWCRNSPDAADTAPKSFGDWLKGDIDVWQERRRGAGAAIEILLPMGAAALGMTGIGIIFHIAASSG